MTVHQLLYDQLVCAAKVSHTLYYSEVALTAGLNINDPSDRNQLARLLGDISVHENQHGRPLLSALVISKEENYPGRGFFDLAVELGVQDTPDDMKFFTEECQKVFDQWKEHNS